MASFKLFNNFNAKKKIALIALVILALLLLLGNYNREAIKYYLSGVDDRIALLKSSGSCVSCDLNQGNFKGIDLKGVDLRYANLSGTILSNTNLSGADLSGANLSNTNLSGTILSNTNLSGADLSGVNLSNTNLSGTILSNTNLSGADLSGANLSNTNLSGTILSNTNLSGADLSGVDLRNKDLTGSNLTGVDLRHIDLTGANLTGVNLSNQDLTGTKLSDGANLNYTNLSGADLSGVDLRHKNLTGTNLTGVDLSHIDLTGSHLIGVDLSNRDLSRTILNSNLAGADLSNTNLSGVDLSNTNLSGAILTYANLSAANLYGVDLSNKDLTGTILTYANLSGANLDGVDLSNKDLTGANLTGVDLSNKDLTGTILKDAKKIEMSLKVPGNSNWPALNEIQNLNVTRYDLNGDVQYLATKEGFLFELKNNESRLVLDLNNDAQFPFATPHEGGFVGIASQNKLVYVSYTTSMSRNDYGELSSSLIVDEYSNDFKKVRNIIKIDGFIPTSEQYAGALVFDSLGKLYLSVGDGNEPKKAQNLNSLRAKILRLDVSKLKLEPEIVAYGIRNPFGVTIDSKDRMFIPQCGHKYVEAVYLLNDLYPSIPPNLGWPVFEGSARKIKDPLMFRDVLAPIFETNVRPGCLTAGVYLDDIESYLLGDFHGTIRLLKQQENGEWYLLHEYKQEKSIWSFGLDKKTKKIFIAPHNLELEISVEQVKLNQ
jgi:uncharacterized protein YjbI with pentapeptide repeats